MENNLFTVGYHKGEMDFGVSWAVKELSYEQMKELRQMIVVGIGQLESMWRSARVQPAGEVAPPNTTPKGGESKLK